MNQPTRGQWKGYAVLCALLAVALLLFVFWPFKPKKPSPAEGSPLEEAIAIYSDSIPSHREYRGNGRPHSYQHQKSQDTDRENFFGNGNKKNYRQREQLRFDINSADTTDLQQLYGIGPVFASRIVKYRELLGGYASLSQLMEVYGMTEERYNQIIPHLYVDTCLLRRIPINQVSLQQLRKHPYLDYYQAKAIILYRERGNEIRNIDDLLMINLIDEGTATKLLPYIQY